ncbi:spondin domain-containing protein [Crocosphaera sp. Alani8]|uniref:spondin domain-containing protein n=1 Tax=Crocosphaera sp. Alani8 TaxID=3038952 RepID=UPI00313A7DB5
MNLKFFPTKIHSVITLLTAGSILTFSSAASALTLKISVESLTPTNGTLLTPVWFGFHDGGFDIYDRDVSLDLFPGVEALVEDGNNGPISTEFSNVAAGIVQGSIIGLEGDFAGPIDPGEIAHSIVDIDPNLASSTYFSYASMILPSNDAFVANGNPLAHRIFSDSGKFIGADFLILGSQVLDGGTEVNDELPANTAFFGQEFPDTGVDENGLVTLHPGFNALGSGGILDDPQFVNADFTASGYQVARIRVEKVPEPNTTIGLVLVLGGVFFLKRVQQTSSKI